MSLSDRVRVPLRITKTLVATVAAFCVAQLASMPAGATARILPPVKAAASETSATSAAETTAASGSGSASGLASSATSNATPRPAAGTFIASASAAGAAAAPSARSAAVASADSTDDVSVGPPPSTTSNAPSAAPAGTLPKATGTEAADAVGGNPSTFRSIVPPEWIEAQGAHAYDRAAAFAAQQDQLVPDSNAQAIRLHAILNKLIPFALKWNDRAKDWHWEIALIKSPDIEAMSLPGGKFVIDTGMLDRLGLNDDETAILIGHLMAHALREHARSRIGESLQTIEQAQGIPTGITARGMEGNHVNIAPELLGMRYGPDDETEADVIGADITSRAGFDPRAGLAYWSKIDRISRWRSPPAFTAAHPISDKRLKDLKKRQKDMLELYAKAIGKSVGNLPPYREGKWNPDERGR